MSSSDPSSLVLKSNEHFLSAARYLDLVGVARDLYEGFVYCSNIDVAVVGLREVRLHLKLLVVAAPTRLGILVIETTTLKAESLLFILLLLAINKLTVSLFGLATVIISHLNFI